MNDFIGTMVSRTIYAYVSEIVLGPRYDEKENNWWVIVDVIWNDNGCPMRENCKILKFETEHEAKQIKIGTCVDSEKKFSWIN